ncbi:MAG: MFS transporter [Candidatus Hodarchaeota archaeon]
MKEDDKEVATGSKTSIGKIFKKTWPLALNYMPGTFTWGGVWFSINIIHLSRIIWADNDIHAQELGFALGLPTIILALAGLIWGPIIDKFNRRKLLSFQTAFDGIGFASIGFIPEGMRAVSFIALMAAIMFKAIFAAGGAPIISSFTDDALEESEKSQFHGVAASLQQVLMIGGMMITTSIFGTHWRVYFWVVGGIEIVAGVIIFLKAEEPKRGVKKDELRSILKLENKVYNYQITRETMKSTIFSPSNLIILVEGIFTQMIMAVPWFIVFLYIESPPFNVDPFIFSLINMMFAVPGAIFGNVVFSKISDKYGKKNIRNRVIAIFFGLLGLYGVWFMYFLIPIPPLTPEEGKSLIAIFSHPWYLVGAIAVFFGGSVSNLFIMNQRPLVQKLNLPEAQGAITSANLFLESLGRGIGTLMAGTLLNFFQNDFKLTVLVLMGIGLIGAALWLIILKIMKKDLDKVSKILESRASDIEATEN